MGKFSFIDANSNDELSSFSEKDILQFIEELRSYRINYREILNIPNNITFGIEIEVCSKDIKDSETLNKALIKLNNLSLNNEWYFDIEKDIPYCTEFVSPILIDSKDAWINIKKVCEVLRENGSIITNDTGGHIHFGLQILGSNTSAWLNFIKLWSIYENIIYRFSYGEYERERDLLRISAKPISAKFHNVYNLLSMGNTSTREIIKKMSIGYKSDAIGIYNYDSKYKKNSTIEIRCPNSSTEEVIWQNNINFFYHFLKYCSSSNFNHEVIDKRIYDILGIQNDLSLYREVFIEQAIELADLIFDNNLDKLNFLRQYLKDYSNSKEFIKCKRLIEKHR